MAKQTVSDAVSGVDLEQVEFNVEPLTLSLASENAIRDTFALRVFVPKVGDRQCHLIEDIRNRLVAMHEQTAGEERAFYQWVILMLRFYYIYPELDPHQTRHFNLKTLDYSDTLQEIAALTQTKRLAKPERLIKIAGETTDSTSRLLLEAIYIRPDLRSPLAHPDYVEFSEQCLSELVAVIEQIDGMKWDAIEDCRREIASDPKLSPEQQVRMLDQLDAIRSGKTDAQLCEQRQDIEKRVEEALRIVVKEVLKIADMQAARFADLVQEARRLQEPISREVAEKHIERLAEDGVSLTQEYTSCIQGRLDTSAVNRLLWHMILRYEEIYELEPYGAFNWSTCLKISRKWCHPMMTRSCYPMM